MLGPGLAPSYLLNLALSREFLSLVPGPVTVRKFAWLDRLAWELEVNAGKHLGRQDHSEVSSAIVFRVNPSSADSPFRTSLAVGEGLSYASSIPKFERVRHAPAVSRLLNYVMFEVTWGPDQPAHRELALRIHHRSGIAGIINGAFGGSYAVLLGLKVRF